MREFIAHNYKSQKAFTLVETLVAISIFSVSLVTLIIVLSGGISNTGYAKKKITAEYLAQEGVEYVRNMRDFYLLYAQPTAYAGWNAFRVRMLSACGGATGCYIDDTKLTNPGPGFGDQYAVSTCSSNCPPVLYQANTGKYGYGNGGTNSGIVRKISVAMIGTDEIRIYSRVYWTKGATTASAEFTADLFNWIEQ